MVKGIKSLKIICILNMLDIASSQFNSNNRLQSIDQMKQVEISDFPIL